jgi:hypothetical protein
VFMGLISGRREEDGRRRSLIRSWRGKENEGVIGEGKMEEDDGKLYICS